MGLILVPLEVRNLIQVMKNSVSSKMELYRKAKNTVQDYIDDNRLDCEAWNASKDTMHVCYQSIVGGMEAAEESILNELDTLEGSIGDEYLDEDELNAKIERLRAQCRQYEQCMESWNKISSNFLNIGFSPAAGGLVEKYNGMIESTEAEIAELQEKIIFLHEVEDSTVNLFEGTIDLLHSVSSAINDGGVTVTGTGEYSGVNWLGTLTIAAQNVNKEIEKEEKLVGSIGYCDSTREFIKSNEGIWETCVKSGEVYSIGYGCDFTKESNPELYEKYVINQEKITLEDADKLLDKKVIKYAVAVDFFISDNNLFFNQNQYDALVSFYYNNGEFVFSEEAYNLWVSKGGEYEERAEARKELKEYLVSANGNYDIKKINELFVASKGPNMKYEYVERRTEEANLFNKDE